MAPRSYEAAKLLFGSKKPTGGDALAGEKRPTLHAAARLALAQAFSVDVSALDDAIQSGDVIAPATPDAMRLVQEVAAIAER
jgi:hypothetical protein